MKKFLRYTLPLGIIVMSLLVVFAMVAISKGKRPERKESGPKPVLVEVIPVVLDSLNLVVNS